MFKNLFFLLGILTLTGTLIACTSPEEKAQNYVQNADALFAEGNLLKAEIEYKNALQINQNQTDAWFGIAKIHEHKKEWLKAYGVLNKMRRRRDRNGALVYRP